MKNRTMQDAYDEYLKSEDKTVFIEGKTFYKVIDRWESENLNTITLHREALRGSGNKATDEKGNVFDVSGPAFIRFSGDIPEWYFEIGEYMVKGIDVSKIGYYVRKIQK